MKNTIACAIAVFTCLTFASLEAQAPQGDNLAKKAIKALGDKLFRADNDEKTALETLALYDGAARELRNTSHWLPRLLKPRQSAAVKIQVLKTMAVIRDPSYSFLAEQVLDDPDDDTRIQAAFTLRQLGPYRKAIPKLMKLTKDQNPKVRFAGVSALGSYGRYFREAMPAVIAGLDDDGVFLANGVPQSVRSVALSALRMSGPDAKEAIPRLVRLLAEEKEHERRVTVASTLAHISPSEPALVDTVRAWFLAGKKDARYRNGAIEVVSAMEQFGKEFLVELIDSLDVTKDREGVYYRGANLGILNYVRRLGPLAKQAVPALEKLASETNDAMFRRELQATIEAIRISK